MRFLRASHLVVACLVILTVTGATAGAEKLSLKLQAGQLMGLNVGAKSLPARAPGGFYVQVYQVQNGKNVLQGARLADLPKPLPAAFAIDAEEKWQGNPTITIKLPEGEPADSGEMVFDATEVRPHRTYLLRFAHRGVDIGGEFPPIMHIRQFDAEGNWVAPQQNLELLCGTYDWREESIALPAVEGAARISFMLHHPRGMGQFWMSEPTLTEVKPQPTVPVPGLWHRERGKPAMFTGSIPGTEVSISALATEDEEVISVSVTLGALTKRIRDKPAAMVLSFRLPLDATGWRWGDYVRQEREIERGRDYSFYALIGRRQFREISWFPMAAVSGPEHGIAVMAPLSPPLLSRMRYDDGRYLCAEFDLGVAARAKGEMETTGFSFDIAHYQPRWGWRAALARYYALYPECFASSAKQGGWWIGPSDKVKDLTDFGLQYAEAHFARPEPTKANDDMGVYTCSYSEPWMWRIPVSEERDPGLARPLRQYLPRIRSDADLSADVLDVHDYWPAPRRDSVRAFLNSGMFGPDGEYQINAVRSYGGGTFIEMSTSCLPEIRSEAWGGMNRGLLSYRYETQADIARCAKGGAKLDGVYFDSIGDWSDISAEDHRSEHFAYASFPLTFSYATGKPVISGLSAMAEYMQFIRGKGFVTMANSDPRYVAFAAPYLDMLGAGENYGDPFVDDQALSHDRSVAYHRSVSFGNSGMLSVPAEEAEKRFRLLLFHHVYPGIFFRDAESLERVRPLYRKYIPLMSEMGAAGWEPIPWASADDPGLMLERYGPSESGTTYFAVRNPGEKAVSSTITIEPIGLNRLPATARQAVEVLSGKEIPVTPSRGTLLVELEVPAGDTAVLRMEWAELSRPAR